jgi:hypothetical protein
MGQLKLLALLICDSVSWIQGSPMKSRITKREHYTQTSKISLWCDYSLERSRTADIPSITLVFREWKSLTYDLCDVTFDEESSKFQCITVTFPSVTCNFLISDFTRVPFCLRRTQLISEQRQIGRAYLLPRMVCLAVSYTYSLWHQSYLRSVSKGQCRHTENFRWKPSLHLGGTGEWLQLFLRPLKCFNKLCKHILSICCAII